MNIFIHQPRRVQEKIKNLYETFQTLLQTRQKRRTKSWQEKVTKFNEDVAKNLFDISTSDPQRIIQLSEKHDIKIGGEEKIFLKDQQTERKGYCDTFVDRKWDRAMKRKLKEQDAMDRSRSKDESFNRSVRWSDIDTENDSSDENNHESEDEDQPPVAKRKYKKQEENRNDAMPLMWRHLRSTNKLVKPEFNTTVDRLISQYHCSKRQAVAGVIHTANSMFGRNWKFQKKGKEKAELVDMDTAPFQKQIRESGKCIEALALKEIADEIAKGDDVVVTWHDDGSKKKDNHNSFSPSF